MVDELYSTGMTLKFEGIRVSMRLERVVSIWIRRHWTLILSDQLSRCGALSHRYHAEPSAFSPLR